MNASVPGKVALLDLADDDDDDECERFEASPMAEACRTVLCFATFSDAFTLVPVGSSSFDGEDAGERGDGEKDEAFVLLVEDKVPDPCRTTNPDEHPQIVTRSRSFMFVLCCVLWWCSFN